MTSGGEHTALKRALAALGAVVALVVCVLAFARCSTPSTLHTGPVTVDPAQLLGPANATAAAMRAIEEWAPGTGPELVEAAWRGAGSDSMRVVALVEGAAVQVVVEHGANGWVVPHPPRPAELLSASSWWPLDDPPAANATDPRWQTAVGFLDAWLTGGDTGRWVATQYRPPALSTLYPGWQITGAGAEIERVRDDLYLVAVEYSAPTRPGGDPRAWRVYVAVAQDATGRWTVTGVAAGRRTAQ